MGFLADVAACGESQDLFSGITVSDAYENMKRQSNFVWVFSLFEHCFDCKVVDTKLLNLNQPKLLDPKGCKLKVHELCETLTIKQLLDLLHKHCELSRYPSELARLTIDTIL